MTTYKRPDVYIEEQFSNDQPITGVGTAITGFAVIAERGPVSYPVMVNTIDAYKRVFGEAIEGEAGYYALDGFFKNGGKQAYVNRLAHYTDPSNKATLVAATADEDFDGIGVTEYANYTGNAAITTFASSDAATMKFALKGAGGVGADEDITIVAKPATTTGVGGTFLAGGVGDTASYRVNGGPTKSLNMTAVGPTLADWKAAFAAQMEGVLVDEVAGQIKLTTDRQGSTAEIILSSFGATFAAKSGLTAGTYDDGGLSNVANVDAVTFNEIKALIEGATWAADTLTATQNSLGYLILQLVPATGTSPAGSDTEIDLKSGTAALLTSLGLTGLGSQGAHAKAIGSDTAASPALTIKAGYMGEESPGTKGNEYSITVEDDPKHTSAGAGNDLQSNITAADTHMHMKTVTGIAEGSYLLLDDGVNTEYVEVTSITTSLIGGSVSHVVTIKATAGFVNSFLAAGTTVVSCEHTITVYEGEEVLETWSQLSMNPSADNYVATMINDSEVGSNYVTVEDLGVAFPGNVLGEETTPVDLTGGTSETIAFVDADVLGSSTAKTGIYAFDEVSDLSLVCIPPSFGTKSTIGANTKIHNAMLLYAEGRMDCFAILDCPENRTVTQMATYRTDTLGADNMWGAIYYPFIEVSDPIGIGNNPTVMVPPSGSIAGVYARVDELPPPNGGVHTAPAGEGKFGKLYNAVGLERYLNDSDQDILNPLGVNCIRKFSRGGAAAPGIIAFGARTLSTLTQWKYIQVRRIMTYIEQSVRTSTRWAIFRNNDYRLWGTLTNKVTSFLSELFRNGQLNGNSATEAFFVKCDETTTTPTDVANGRVVIIVGVSCVKPAEFIIFKIAQMQDGSAVTE